MSTSRLYALVRVMNAYHSGQSSREYRILCRAMSALQRRGIANPIDQVEGHSRIKPQQWPVEFQTAYRRDLRRFARLAR